MSLATPDRIRTLQEARGTKAKQEPAYRFYLRYDKVYRADLLAHAYALAKQRGGVAGVDGETFEAIETADRERWLAAVQEALRTETDRPQPVRRVMIPKPGGGERPLGIPTIRDRVVQTAVLLEAARKAKIVAKRAIETPSKRSHLCQPARQLTVEKHSIHPY